MIKVSDVVVIIPHLGTTPEQEYAFDECYASLKESVPDMHIVVAKNGPACPHPRDVRIVSQGQCKAVNAAVAMTNEPWILVTNDDMIYPPGWWHRLADTRYNMNYKNFCISPQLVEPQSGAPTFQIQSFGGAGGDFKKEEWINFANKYESKRLEWMRYSFNLPFLISRELWNTIGGYDINYDPWGSNSDSDLEYKIKLAGVQPYQNTNCLVYHFSQTSGTFHPDNRDHWQQNWDYFIEKWGFPRTDEGIWEAIFDIPKPPIRKFCPPWEGKYGQI